MERPRLKTTTEVFSSPGGDICLLRPSADADLVLEGAGERGRELVARLDGQSSRAALVEEFGADRVDELLDLLVGEGLVEDAGAYLALTEAERGRYDRQLRYFADVAPDGMSAPDCQLRLRAARVLVLGVGGLGSWAALSLACCGVGELTVVDGDAVELSNLNRQILFAASDVGRPKVHAAADALRRFNPETALEARRRRLGSADDVAEVVEGCDFVVETADWPLYELPRWVDRACRARGIPHITAAQHPPLVRVGPMRIPGRSPCLACVEQADRARFPLAGELEAFRAARERPSPTLGTASGLIGTLIATEVVHHLTGAHRPCTLNRSLVFDLATFERRLEPGSITACPHT
jgi:molybdopterin/thiamine biosynthesis adenylyltransferase